MPSRPMMQPHLLHLSEVRVMLGFEVQGVILELLQHAEELVCSIAIYAEDDLPGVRDIDK